LLRRKKDAEESRYLHQHGLGEGIVG